MTGTAMITKLINFVLALHAGDAGSNPGGDARSCLFFPISSFHFFSTPPFDPGGEMGYFGGQNLIHPGASS